MPVENRWYDGLGARWWEQHGPVAALHEVARCVHAGLAVREVRGLSLRASAPRAVWGSLRRRELGGFRVSGDLRLSFIGFATTAVGPKT